MEFLGNIETLSSTGIVGFLFSKPPIRSSDYWAAALLFGLFLLMQALLQTRKALQRTE